MSENKVREATVAYEAALTERPNDVPALFNLGKAYAMLGYLPQAIERWNKVVQLSPDPTVRQRASDNIARAQQKLAATAPAPAPVAAAPAPAPVAAAPTPAPAPAPVAAAPPPTPAPAPAPAPESTRTQARQYYEGGVQLITQRRYGEALNYLNESLKLEPTLTVGYVARGSTLIGLRRFAEAAVDYQYALRLDPQRADVLYGLGEAYRGMNRVDDARTYYQRYLASNGPDVRAELQNDARTKLSQLR